MQTKICTKCGKELTLDHYSRNPRGSYGLQSRCKSCRALSEKEYRLKYPEKGRATARERGRANPEKVKERAERWRKKNPERQKELNKRWYENNKDIAKENGRKWREANREKVREKGRQWYIDNHEKACVFKKVNKMKRRKNVNGSFDNTWNADVDINIRLDITNCIYCGDDLNKTNTQIDHVFPLSKGGIHSKYNMWPICATCNKKKYNNSPYDFVEDDDFISGYPTLFILEMEMASRMSQIGNIELAEKHYKEAYKIGKDRSDLHRDYGYHNYIIKNTGIA